MKKTVRIYQENTGIIRFSDIDSADDLWLKDRPTLQTFLGTTEIEIKEPKKKVKKWRWAIKYKTTDVMDISMAYYSEEEANNGYNFTAIQKIDSTEQEFEE